MDRKFAAVCIAAALLGGTAFAAEGAVPQGVPRLDHVLVIMMENHGFQQIIGNPNAPFANRYAASANVGTNYFAVGHPSLTNYLEIVGGSNFGIQDDNNPDWHSNSCTTNLQSSPNLEGMSNKICPISGSGKDGATPAIDFSNETSGPPGVINVNGTVGFAAAPNTAGKTIADQLVASGRSWKSYQESLPLSGADNVNFSDGFFTDKTVPFTVPLPNETQTLIKLYAAKHDPFVYFQNVQEGWDPRNSLDNVVPFAGPHGLFADLKSGNVPEFSLIAPNQCNDQHGRENAGPGCDFDPNNDGTQNGLNPALISIGDSALQNIVNAIHESPAWRKGHNAIVVVWDEDDFSVSPTTNQVLLIVDSNYGPHRVVSGRFYTHFSLLKSIEAGFGLPCLNHACDDGTKVMSDLFSENNGQ